MNLGLGLRLGGRRGGGLLSYGWSESINLGVDGDYFVAPDGDDGDAGTFAAPFATIQYAVNAAKAAGGQRTIRVRAGTYREDVSITAWDGTSGDKNVLAGYGTDRPIITGGAALTGWAQCTAADAAALGSTLGVAESPIWKVTIAKTVIGSPSDGSLYTAHIIEDDAILPIAYDRAADGPNPLIYNDDGNYHSATAFGLDGSGDIETITDADVIGEYTPAQLERMWASYFRFPNFTSITPVVSATSDTVTIAPASAPDGSGNRYGLLNALPNMTQGRWGLADNGDGTVTYFVWPNDETHLANGMEVMARSNGVGIYGSDHVSFEGFELRHFTGTPLTIGRLGNNEGRLSGASVRHVLARSCFGNGIKGEILSNLTLENVSVADVLGSYGISLTDYSDERASDGLRLLHCDVLRAEQSPLQLYSQHDALIAYSRFRDCGQGAHANLFNNYVGSDAVLYWGIKVENCGGYATWQQSTNTIIGMSSFPPGTGGDAIRDQNGGGGGAEPVHPSHNWVVNNTLEGRNIDVGSSTPQGQHTHHVMNNLAGKLNGQTGAGHTTFFDVSGNLLTNGAANSANMNSVFDTEVLPTDVFTDPDNGDYSLKEGSVIIGLGARNLEAKLAEWEALYGFDLHRDVDGVPFTTLAFVGARSSVYVADTTSPVLTLPTAAEASAAALDISVTTDDAEGAIWWVASTSETAPTTAQIAAGNDHTGSAAIGAGQIAATAAGTPLTSQATGLDTGTTYHIYFTHEDRAGNLATVVTASAATTALPDGVYLLQDFDESVHTYKDFRTVTFGPAEAGDLRIALGAQASDADMPLPAGWTAGPINTWNGTSWDTEVSNGSYKAYFFYKEVTETEASDTFTFTFSARSTTTAAGTTLRGDSALTLGANYTPTLGDTFEEPLNGALVVVGHRYGSASPLASPDYALDPSAPVSEGIFDIEGPVASSKHQFSVIITPHTGGTIVRPTNVTSPFGTRGFTITVVPQA